MEGQGGRRVPNSQILRCDLGVRVGEDLLQVVFFFDKEGRRETETGAADQGVRVGRAGVLGGELGWCTDGASPEVEFASISSGQEKTAHQIVSINRSAQPTAIVVLAA